MNRVGILKPDSLTVHSLAIKRAAALNIFKDKYEGLCSENTDELMDMTYDFAESMGMKPYYLYRQKNMSGNFENVGFAREDILDGKIKNAMIIGKGSLFLGRMTNLFDGVSFVIHGNTAAVQEEAAGVSEEEVKGLIAKAMKEFAATLMAE